jgi:hypothetical protein
VKTMRTMDRRSLAAISRLADALDTTVEELLLHAPPSWAEPAADAGRLEEIEEVECLHLLRTAEIARLAYVTDAGPAILPVTYAMVDGRPVFRTAAGSPLSRLAGERVAMEVDRVDVVRREGWSVVVTGIAHTIAGALVNGPDGTARVEPWPAGERETYVFVQPGRVTGRRIVRD